MVEGIRGHRYEKPVPAMRAYLDGITKGEAGSENWPIVIAALGPLMLKLCGREDARRGALQHDAAAHGRGGTKSSAANKWLAIEQKVTLETDPAKARALGRKELSRYMVLDNYRNNWLRIGFSEAELANGGSRPLHRCDGAVGWRGQGEAGLRAHFDGRRDACLHPAGARRRRHRRRATAY